MLRVDFEFIVLITLVIDGQNTIFPIRQFVTHQLHFGLLLHISSDQLSRIAVTDYQETYLQ